MNEKDFSNITIRLAEEQDANKLHVLVIAYLNYYQITPPSADELLDFIVMICQNTQAGHFFIAEQGNDILGFATIYKTYSTFKARPALLLNDLFIRPEYRKQNIATQLWQYIKDFYYAGNYAYLEWMTAPDNIAANNFYQKHHAKKTDWVVYTQP